MFRSAAYASLLFLLVRNSYASVLLSRQSRTIQLGEPTGNSTGALYFLTNDLDNNYVVTSDVNIDGTLALRYAIPTGGKGGHGKQSALGPNPLFSDGSCRAHGAGLHALVAVNAGSNTMTLFQIDPENPALLRQVGEPVDTGGDFPVSMAYNDQGDFGCVVNGGAKSSIQCFDIDVEKGLTPVPDTLRTFDIQQTTPPTGPAGAIGHILFTADNSQIVISVRGRDPTPGFLALWNITEDTHALSESFQKIDPPRGGLEPASMTRLIGSTAFLATDTSVGFELYNFTKAGGSPVGEAVPIPGQVSTSWSLASTQTHNFYLSDLGAARITEVNVTATDFKPSIIAQYNLPENDGPMDLVVSNLGGTDHLIVLSANATAITSFRLNSPGNATLVQRLELAQPAEAAGLKVDPNFLTGLSNFIRS